MVRYLEIIVNRLSGLKNGMGKNTTLWTGQPETTANVQTKIDALNAKGKEIDDLEDALKIKRAEARTLSQSGEKYADKLENLAIGLHNETPEKLADYDVKLRKPNEAVSKPSKTLTVDLKDDTDGQGFIVSTPGDGDATHYLWSKGEAADPKDTNTIPPLHLFKTTTKTTWVDDDIEKGKRYFYQVEAVNAKGKGPPSVPVSRVQ